MKDENTFRKLLRNEITWLIIVASAVVAFYKTVVIPINNLLIPIYKSLKK